MSQVNFNQQPAFGMAFRFQEGGAKRMAEAFKNIPDEARKLVKGQLHNKDVDTIVTATEVKVEPKIYKAQIGKLMKELKYMTSDYRPFIHNIDYTDPKILAARDEIRDAAKLSTKVQDEINRLKNADMSVDDFAKELENLAE